MTFLTELSFLANNRIQIIAASNIDATNAFLIIRKSDIHGVHAGSSVHTYLDATVDNLRNDSVHTELKKNTISDVDKMKKEPVMKIEPKNGKNVDSTDIQTSVDDAESKLKLCTLFGGYDCVSTEKVDELVTIVNTAVHTLLLPQRNIVDIRRKSKYSRTFASSVINRQILRTFFP